MPQNPTYSCYLGAQGWQHADWQGAFYPDDLPPDWQLAYYNNFFGCVYLGHAEWRAASLATWRARLDDMQPQFRLLLETPANLDDAAREILTLLAPYIALRIDTGEARPELIWFDRQSELKPLAQAITRARADTWSIFLISRDSDLGKIEQVRTLLEVLGC